MENAKTCAAVLLGPLLIACSAPSTPPDSMAGTWTTYHGDSARDGHPAVATLDSAAARRLKLAWRVQLSGSVDGTPAMAPGLVIADSMGGQLAAIDASTGREVWQEDGLGPMSASPALAGNLVLVSTLDGHVRAFNVKSGSPVWDWEAPDDQTAIWSSPAVVGSIVVVGSASPYGDAPLRPGRLSGLDALSGRQVWSFCLLPGCAQGDGVWSTASFDASGTGFVGIGNPGDGVLAFDPRTGEIHWRVSLYPDSSRDLDVGASPVVLDDGGREAIAVASVYGLMSIRDASNGDVINEYQLVKGGAVGGLLATPAYDGSLLYAASAGTPSGLLAVHPDSGSTAWMFGTDLPVYSAPIAAHGVVVFGTGNVFGDVNTGTVTVVSTSGGHQLWSYDTRSAVRSSPAVVGDTVMVGDVSGEVLAFRPGS